MGSEKVMKVSQLKNLEIDIQVAREGSFDHVKKLVEEAREKLLAKGKGRLGVRAKNTKNTVSVEWYLRYFKKTEDGKAIRSQFIKKGQRHNEMYDPKKFLGRVNKGEFEIFCYFEPQIAEERAKVKACNQLLREVKKCISKIESDRSVDGEKLWTEFEAKKMS